MLPWNVADIGDESLPFDAFEASSSSRSVTSASPPAFLTLCACSGHKVKESRR